MKRILLIASLLCLLIPTVSFAQLTDTDPTLKVKLTSTAPYTFKAPDGSTIILGEVENTNDFPVWNVLIRANFYDDHSKQPLDATNGTTLLHIVPAKSKAPYVITSPSSNAAITNASVKVTGFNSAPTKPFELLTISFGPLRIGEDLVLSGTVTNEGESSTDLTKIHLLSYDAFERIVSLATVEVENIDAENSIDFKITSDHNERAFSYKIVAESKNYQSIIYQITDVQLSYITKLVTINNVTVTDPQGNKFSELKIDSPVHITGDLWFRTLSDTESKQQPFVYYVQIIQIGSEGAVEFIGFTEGNFDNEGNQVPTVVWTPEHEGPFFIQVYVWDPDANPLSTPSSDINLVLVT